MEYLSLHFIDYVCKKLFLILCRGDIFVEEEENGIRLKSQSGFTASIVEQDITACSSVAHIIDSLLLPMSKENALAQLPGVNSPSAG